VGNCTTGRYTNVEVSGAKGCAGLFSKVREIFLSSAIVISVQ